MFATLRGPFFAVGEEELLAWHALGHGFRPYRVPEDVPRRARSRSPRRSATLRELNRARNHRPVADTIGRLIAATRAHAGFMLWRGGEQVLANVLQIAELARRYEVEGGLSFRGFVDKLRDAADRAPTPEAPILEEGSDGVRLMTVHKAKGLEFPVVILADIGCKLSRDDASRYLDPATRTGAIRLGGWSPLDLRDHNALEAARDAAEGVRLAYVAATRARDLLVVPAVGDGPQDRDWVRPLSAALYGGDADDGARRAGASPAATRIVDRPPDNTADAAHHAARRLRHLDPIDRRAVHRGVVGSAAARPAGRRAPRPAARAPDRQGRAGRRRGGRSRSATSAGATGATPRDRAAPRPSLRVMTATEWVRASRRRRHRRCRPRSSTPPRSVQVIDAGVVDDGAAVRASASARSSTPCSRTCRSTAGPAEIARMAAVQARMFGAGDDERAAAAAMRRRRPAAPAPGPRAGGPGRRAGCAGARCRWSSRWAA